LTNTKTNKTAREIANAAPKLNQRVRVQEIAKMSA